ncbi:choice-of-anchor I family protein [Rariglobus hedericola]|nr:choice-of-anchor I family protein [Rariglobus hedericola]
MNHPARLLITALAAVAPFAVPAHAELNFLGGVSLPNSAEILSYDKATSSLLSTYSSATGQGVQIYTLGSNGALGAVRNVNLSGAAFALNDTFSLSSVVVDTQNRDFAVATLIPKANNTTQGKAVFFQVSTGTVLTTLDVGYHPDSVTITPDGTRIVIANEGEATGNPDNPSNVSTTPAAGSISVINLSGITNTAGIQGLTGSAVTTKTFEAANLANGVSIENLRNNRDVPIAATLGGVSRIASGDRYLDIEPEYITTTNTTAYISLQENNAIAVYDLATDKITAIHDLGTVNQRMDASNAGGDGINVNDTVAALRSPDTIAKFERAGTTYIVTANEGDYRPDDADRITYAAAVTAGLVDPATKAALDAQYAGNSTAPGALGNLRISKIDGDTNGDGKIDVVTTISSRSISIVNGNTGAVVFDSGSMIEDFVAANDPTTFNINAEGSTMANFAGTLDSRSRDKGPEIEAVAFGSVDGHDYIFAAAERQNGIFAFDVTDLNNIQIVDYYNLLTGENGGGDYRAPESLLFISAADSPTGKALLIAGFEISGSIAVFDLSGISAIPEPASAAALLGAASLGLVLCRRRR